MNSSFIIAKEGATSSVCWWGFSILWKMGKEDWRRYIKNPQQERFFNVYIIFISYIQYMHVCTSTCVCFVHPYRTDHNSSQAKWAYVEYHNVIFKNLFAKAFMASWDRPLTINKWMNFQIWNTHNDKCFF